VGELWRKGNVMGSIATLLAVLLVAGSLAALPLYADEGDGGGDGYSEPPAAEDGTLILAEEGGGGDGNGEPSPEEARNVVSV
jgi:hypothetical protein